MQKLLLLLFCIATFTMMVVVGKTGRPLKTAETPLGILHLEFAYNKNKVENVIRAWTPSDHNRIDNISVARKNTLWDMLFLFSYAAFLYLLLKNIALRLTPNSRLQKTAALLAPLAIFAGIFDIIENEGIFLSLRGNISDAIALTTFIPSVAKWLIVVCLLLFLLLALPIAYIIPKNQSSSKQSF